MGNVVILQERSPQHDKPLDILAMLGDKLDVMGASVLRNGAQLPSTLHVSANSADDEVLDGQCEEVLVFIHAGQITSAPLRFPGSDCD
jgi:hypothetical protein